jgi:hypothetical protein
MTNVAFARDKINALLAAQGCRCWAASKSRTTAAATTGRAMTEPAGTTD